MKFVKIITYVPVESAEKVRQAMHKAGAGTWSKGKYDQVSSEVKAIGRFRPLPRAEPTIGKIGEVSEVKETRIEMLCQESKYESIIKAIKASHPYEEPAIEVIPLLYPR